MFVCPSVSKSVMSRNRPIARSETGNVYTCEGMQKLAGPKTDLSRSRWENACVSMVFELFAVTCANHVWTLLHNSPFGATHALRVLSSKLSKL